MSTVRGPTFTLSTSMCARNRPVATVAPRCRSASTNRVTSGSATSAGAAAVQLGRRPLRTSPYNVNWLTTSSGAATSAADRSSSRILSSCTLRAMASAVRAVSVWVTPSSTRRPSSTAPTTSPSTVTLARLTVCTTARTLGPGRCEGPARVRILFGRKADAQRVDPAGGELFGTHAAILPYDVPVAAYFLLSVHVIDGAPEPAPDVMARMYRDVDLFNAELKAEGAWVFAGGLEPPSTAMVVRHRDGEVLTTDGPFTETKEQIGGFWVVEAADMAAALALAERASRACGGPVEVRPFQAT